MEETHPERNTQIELPDFDQDVMLRREAGEGWKFSEPEPYLFDMIVSREILIESMKHAGLHPPAKSENTPGEYAPVYEAYLAMNQSIDEQKQELDITTPPPLPLEQED
jgi:hypothetical protein